MLPPLTFILFKCFAGPIFEDVWIWNLKRCTRHAVQAQFLPNTCVQHVLQSGRKLCSPLHGMLNCMRWWCCTFVILIFCWICSCLFEVSLYNKLMFCITKGWVNLKPRINLTKWYIVVKMHPFIFTRMQVIQRTVFMSCMLSQRKLIAATPKVGLN